MGHGSGLILRQHSAPIDRNTVDLTFCITDPNVLLPFPRHPFGDPSESPEKPLPRPLERKQEKEHAISHDSLQGKGDHLGKEHHQPANRSTVKEKSQARAQHHGKTEFSVVGFVKQKDQSDPCEQTKEEILEKHDQPQKAAFLPCFSLG